MNQVGGTGAVYFDPTDTVAAAIVISENLNDNEAIVSSGFSNALRFTQENMSEKYLAVYHGIARNKP